MPDTSEGKVPTIPSDAQEVKDLESKVQLILQKEARLEPRAPQRATSEIVNLTLSTWKAPLPPPGILNDYENIVPGCAKDIIAAFTSQVAHRHKMEGRALILQFSGLACGFIALLAMLGLAGYAVTHGQPWVAGVIGGSLAAVVGVFVWKAPKGGNGTKPAPTTTTRGKPRAKR